MSETNTGSPLTVNESDETPIQAKMQVLPRGGAREVGRSCYQVNVRDRTYLVGCGIKQGYTTEYPLIRDLSPGAVDAVFLTHAHVDHIDALPVAEQRGLLADDAPIITTRPTDALAHILLHDSLKIHKIQAEELDQPQRFTVDDVEKILGSDRHRNVSRESLSVSALAVSGRPLVGYHPTPHESPPASTIQSEYA